MKNKRNWSNSEMRSLTRGEAMHYFSTGQHYSTKEDWYIWFLGNATRYSIFQTFLWKYGNGNMEIWEWTSVNLKHKSREAATGQQFELGVGPKADHCQPSLGCKPGGG